MSKKLSEAEKARRAWVRALRSGKYKWGKNALQPSDGKFCCLGVLCEVAIKHGFIKYYDGDKGRPSSKVQRWVGLREDDGSFYKGSLININDCASRNPFQRIANLIEKKPAGLFVEEVS